MLPVRANADVLQLLRACGTPIRIKKEKDNDNETEDVVSQKHALTK